MAGRHGVPGRRSGGARTWRSRTSAGTDPGEIVVRGANLFSGYWPDGRDGPDADGWWATGDMAYADARRRPGLVDRIGELILVHGFNVYPAEIERVLDAHPEVAEAAVVGVPDPVSGQTPVRVRGGGLRPAADAGRTAAPTAPAGWPGSSCRRSSRSSASSALGCRQGPQEESCDEADPDQPGRLPPVRSAPRRAGADRRAVGQRSTSTARSSCSATTATGCRCCCWTAGSTATGGSRRLACAAIWPKPPGGPAR